MPVLAQDGRYLPELTISKKTAGPPVNLQDGGVYKRRTGLLDARALASGLDGWEHCPLGDGRDLPKIP